MRTKPAVIITMALITIAGTVVSVVGVVILTMGRSSGKPAVTSLTSAHGVTSSLMAYKFEGSSMTPTINDGDQIQVDVTARAPHRGDIIAFHPPLQQGGDSKDFIKRVIGMPGDTVDVHDNVVTVNGQQVEESYIKQRTECQGQYCHMVLGPDQYYVMGDNRTNSSDSRFWGPVQADKIIGTARLPARPLPSR